VLSSIEARVIVLDCSFSEFWVSKQIPELPLFMQLLSNFSSALAWMPLSLGLLETQLLFDGCSGCGVSSWRLDSVCPPSKGSLSPRVTIAGLVGGFSFLAPPLSKGEDATAIWIEIETHPALHGVQQELPGGADPAAQ
jgi:hypothetical protein